MRSQPDRFTPTPETAPELTVVHFAGRQVSLNEVVLYGIRDQLLALADEPSGSELHLDFGNVAFISSTGLNTLVSLRQKLLACGRHLSIRNLSAQVHEVFTVTSLHKLLDLRPAGLKAEPDLDSRRPNSPAGVLVVDDHEPVRALLEVALRSQGFEVRTAAHGQQALDLYGRHREETAVVLLDVHMPGIDGRETFAALKTLCPTVCCCFMTANPTPDLVEALMQRGAARVFRKPFSFSEVIDTLKQLTSRPLGPRHDRWIEIPMRQERMNDVGAES
jgi:anti-anti-sigma factor